MVLINRKEDCSGCGACEQICPKCCIKLVSDSEGYLYPQVDIKNCVNCRLCEQVCPVKNPDKPHKPLNVYAAKNKDDIVRYNSSSGGIFTIIAEKVLAKGGIVFGVRFDKDYNVIFDHTVTTNDLENFRRSKYVQAKLGNAYKHVKTFLSQKRLVLFTGTPCQIAGLRHFLRKDYDNLILVDLICEGVPSPKVWNRYLSEEISRLCKKYSTQTLPLTKKNIAIENISFRDKIIGWKEFSFKIEI